MPAMKLLAFSCAWIFRNRFGTLHMLLGAIKVFAALFFIRIVCLATPAAPTAQFSDLEYTISIDWREEFRQLVMTLSFNGETDGTTIIKLPHAWA
ncbi:MAG: hypothetical protein JSV44_07660, partial [Candidatus Zixiibacteriota bacterium]